MIILALDSTSDLIVTLKKDDFVYKYESNGTQRKHNSEIVPAIDKVLTDASVSIEDVDVFACVVGPGSFTGIRIGVSTIKAFALALNKKVIPINALEVMAHSYNDETYYCFIDAMHDNYYGAKFNNDYSSMSDLKIYAKSEIDLLDSKFVHIDDNSNKADNLMAVAYKKALAGKFGELEPFYLRKSQAERELDGE